VIGRLARKQHEPSKRGSPNLESQLPCCSRKHTNSSYVHGWVAFVCSNETAEKRARCMVRGRAINLQVRLLSSGDSSNSGRPPTPPELSECQCQCRRFHYSLTTSTCNKHNSQILGRASCYLSRAVIRVGASCRYHRKHSRSHFNSRYRCASDPCLHHAAFNLESTLLHDSKRDEQSRHKEPHTQ
jgi:hypothetical protein